MAGGRYDGLVARDGRAADVPAVGWAAGIERLAMLLAASRRPRRAPVAIVPIGDGAEAAALAVLPGAAARRHRASSWPIAAT